MKTSPFAYPGRTLFIEKSAGRERKCKEPRSAYSVERAGTLCTAAI